MKNPPKEFQNEWFQIQFYNEEDGEFKYIPNIRYWIDAYDIIQILRMAGFIAGIYPQPRRSYRV